MRRTVDLASGPLAVLDTAERVGASIGLDDELTPQPIVLLVPGYTGSKEDFLPLLRPFRDHDYRAVAIDQRGQYESGWAADPAGYRIDALAADLVELAATLSTQSPAASRSVHLVGHSFGGLVGRAAAIAKPGLFASFTLLSSGPGVIGGRRRRTLDSGEPVLARDGMAGLWEHMASVSRADPTFVDLPVDVARFLQRRFLANDPVGLQVMGEELRTERDRTDELRRTGLPLLVLHGVDDDAWPPAVQAEMATRLGARYVVVPAAAHSPAVENPAATMAALANFLNAVQA
ncbi:alpha/beta hydrolase [Jatrophihabitans telluris]|uniref:Alpha/beta hydrolase n=1 Tax=Jatrophihabitans telluris TaxID=2038343 RepID=A0ABY4R415_9ACTN|nr:alpha/beta hydrolase [Jatrophihabitans telluris]UQX89709.1 alpha/beta hydrolase [Jatrophihabitans telluris]